MNKNGNYCLCLPDLTIQGFLLEIFGKKFRQKSLHKDKKIIRPVWNFGNLAVRELPFRLVYHLFGSLMPALTSFALTSGKPLMNFLETFYKLVTIFLQASNKLLLLRIILMAKVS